MKIRIIGYAGSGKTSLTLKLQEKYHIQGISLDDYLKIRDKNIRLTKLNKRLEALPNWIVEGVQVSKWTEKSVQDADLIILLDYPLSLTQYRVTKRAINQFFESDIEFSQRRKSLKRMFKLYKWNRRFKKRLPDIKRDLYHSQAKFLILESPEDEKRIHREIKQVLPNNKNKKIKKSRKK